MRVAANLNFLFQDVPLLQRYAKAAAAGFRFVEVALPYSEPAEELRKAADLHGIRHSLINAPTGNWAAGSRGLAAILPKNEFSESVEMAIHYAKTLDCDKVHVMAGVVKDEELKEAMEKFIQNVKIAAERFSKENIICLLEPINQISIPGYFLRDYDQAALVMKEIDMPNLKIQFDVFHAQQICGRLTKTVKDLGKDIGYIQVAQVPSRNEPGTEGEIDFGYLFKMLSQENNDWFVGCEYASSPKDDFSWVQRFDLDF